MTVPTHWPWPSDTRNLWGPPRERHGPSTLNVPLFIEMKASREAGEVEYARRFRESLNADGWTGRKTYGHEDFEQASTHERDGFKVQIISRPGEPDEPPLPTGLVNMWCPQGISVMPLPLIYPGFDAIKALVRTCPVCQKTGVETVRVAFANRACRECAPELRRQLETPGWCD